MAGGLTGNLDQWPLPELLNMLGSSRQSGRVVVEHESLAGAVFLQEGQLVHAATASEAGVQALTTLFGMHEGSFCFEPRVPAPAITLDRPLDTLIAEVQREAQERETIRRMIPSANAVPSLAVRAPEQPVTLQPGEWVLVALANGSRSISEIAEASSLELPAVMRKLYGLGHRGLMEFANEKPAAAAEPAVSPLAETSRPQLSIVQPERDEVPDPAVAVAPAIEVPIAAPAPPAPPPPTYLSPEFFQGLSVAAASVLGPLASVIVDDALEALHYPKDAFPKQRAMQLVEVIAREIKDDRRRAEFQAMMMRTIRERAA